MSDAFTMFALDQNRTPKTIMKRLTERQAELVGMLLNAQDWAHYQRMVGTIQGLEEALEVCREVEKQQEN